MGCAAGGRGAKLREYVGRRRTRGPDANMKTRYGSFAGFYPFYLSEHSNRTCRRLHFVGTSAAFFLILQAIESLNGWWILAALVAGYGFAWFGHVFFERNRPATFSHPFYSFVGDWVMWKDMLFGKILFWTKDMYIHERSCY